MSQPNSPRAWKEGYFRRPTVQTQYIPQRTCIWRQRKKFFYILPGVQSQGLQEVFEALHTVILVQVLNCYLCVCLVKVGVFHLHADAGGGQKRVSYPLWVVLHMAVSLVWMLGTELGFSKRAASAFNQWGIFPPHSRVLSLVSLGFCKKSFQTHQAAVC